MNKLIRMFKNFISDPVIRFAYLNELGLFRSISDEAFLRKKFKLILGYPLNLDDPKTFNEKLQWLKLHDRKPEYTDMVDKYLVKDLVAQKIGETYVTPLYGVWDCFDDIDFDALPDQFVLKTTHDCGGVIVCKDKSAFDKVQARNFINKHMKRQYFYNCREWPYKNIKPRIIAEQFMKDGDNDFLPVYKILCFNGEPKIIQAIQNDKQPDESIDYFDTQWNKLPFRQDFPNSPTALPKPQKLEEMLEIAATLSKDHAFIRIDLYLINGEIYFSEYTFYSDAGFAPFEPEEWDMRLGSWIRLPR